MSRPSSYVPEYVEAICDLVAQGENLDRIGSRKDFPSKDTLYTWLRKHPEFADEYARARAIRADARSDRMDDIGRKVISGEIVPDQARVLIDIEKWQAGKENPKKYGDKLDLKHGGDPESPIRHEHGVESETKTLLARYVDKMQRMRKDDGDTQQG